ncbi:class I SAM-dependent methyltransferase [Deinococcus cellulosilyticus]|uniref:Methyltransferase domain-containing protein n=1 Tax=Deinococcus cellulosilyticus (strain DSM 18568 / NBRC 106333 / KACC 11606 / 5516J-15) TaxID=1223518 RepID=A0A511NA27_DEIC1|nr:class I SAM-dependent methyltransferase [Deinococcus cellulosilyticus]GEM49231.1 hypothetical protein DC3_48660 [Deinococcus cellulosilyticus NBRC 106333 = KACC 11606]
MTDLQGYYARRASEYERIYARPERQQDITDFTLHLQKRVQRFAVLELACGTGYWTERLSRTAKSIHATDIGQEVLDLARSKTYLCPVQFELGDAFRPKPCEVDVVFAGFWFSHVPISRRADFLKGIREAVGAGRPLILMDNLYVEGNSTPISRVDEEGNTHQARHLLSGETHEVLKNFPTREDLLGLMGGEYWSGTYFWGLATTT